MGDVQTDVFDGEPMWGKEKEEYWKRMARLEGSRRAAARSKGKRER